MKIEVYGKQGCSLCKSAMKKIDVFMTKNDVPEDTVVGFMDLETEHGAAEGDFFDVFEIPTVLLLRDDSDVIRRWDGKAPSFEDLEQLLCSGDARCAAA